jgi:hypothetical protein
LASKKTIMQVHIRSSLHIQNVLSVHKTYNTTEVSLYRREQYLLPRDETKKFLNGKQIAFM